MEWKQRNSPDFTGTVGQGYWRQFMERNKDKIVGKSGQEYNLNRHNWTTYIYFVQMYSHIIDELVVAGLVVKLDESVWMDRDGNTCIGEAAFGCKVHHKIVRPDLCFCGDEIGGNISIEGDGYYGGEKVLTEKGTIGQRKTSTWSKKFTMISLINFSGEPVRCLLILEGKN